MSPAAPQASHVLRPQFGRARTPSSLPVPNERNGVLIVAPALDGGASDAGAVELTRILSHAGYRPVVASRPGRLVTDITAAGGEFVALDTGSRNPISLLRNVAALTRLARGRKCAVVHALGRSAGWSALLAARLSRTPLITSWYKGFREQNNFKRVYNGVMARGDRVIAVSDQLAQLVHDRYQTDWNRIAVVPLSIDVEAFNPAAVSRDRIRAMQDAWGIAPDTKVILVTGRILRRKGHHIVVRAAQRLKERGLTNFMVVFVGEDRGRSRYTGELWDLVLSTNTVDVIRMAAPVRDMAAAYAAASVVVSAAIQPEGLQRALLEAQAMAKPVVVSEHAAGPDVVLTPPAVPDDRITGLRCAARDESALATALLRLFATPEPLRRAIGQRGRAWVLEHFNSDAVTERTLRVYADVIGAADAVSP